MQTKELKVKVKQIKALQPLYQEEPEQVETPAELEPESSVPNPFEEKWGKIIDDILDSKPKKCKNIKKSLLFKRPALVELMIASNKEQLAAEMYNDTSQLIKLRCPYCKKIITKSPSTIRKKLTCQNCKQVLYQEK